MAELSRAEKRNLKLREHVLANQATVEKVVDEVGRDEIIAKLNALGVKYAKNAKTETLIKLLEKSEEAEKVEE